MKYFAYKYKDIWKWSVAEFLNSVRKLKPALKWA